MPDSENPPNPSPDAPPDEGEGEGSSGGEDELTKLKRQARHHAEEARKAKADAAKNADAARRLAELENANKSELERAAEALKAAEAKASEAEGALTRMRVAFNKGLTESQAKRLVGTTLEELEADADELLTTFKPPENNAVSNGNGNIRPRENLRAGTAPNIEPALNVKEVVDKMMANR